MESAKLRELLQPEPSDLSDDDLAQLLTKLFTAETVPPCRVCGGVLSVASAGGGRPTIWACSGMEETPGDPNRLRWQKDRRPADEHYSRSRWEQRRNTDPWVLELIKRFNASRS